MKKHILRKHNEFTPAAARGFEEWLDETTADRTETVPGILPGGVPHLREQHVRATSKGKQAEGCEDSTRNNAQPDKERQIEHTLRKEVQVYNRRRDGRISERKRFAYEPDLVSFQSERLLHDKN